MSKDSFKEFVENHREEFETRGQDFQDMWAGIENVLDSKAPLWSAKWVRIAASVLVLMVAGWIGISYQTGEELPYELQETEQHYYRLINTKMEQLSAHHQSVDALIWEDLELLDKEYEILKRDLKEAADQEEVAQAMVENQLAKLDILDQILSEIVSKTEQDVEKLDI